MNGQGSQVATLPPTAGIKDSATRAYLDALANILDARSGNVDKNHPQRFVTAEEFQGMANRAMLKAFGAPGGSVGFPPGAGPGEPGSNIEAINNLADWLSRSLVAQYLQQHIVLIDIQPLRERIDGLLNKTDGLKEGITKVEKLAKDGDAELYELINAIKIRVQNTEGAILQETTLRVNADGAIYADINNVRLRLGSVEAGLIDERNLRITANNAIYDSINAVKLRVDGAEGGIAAETNVRVSRDNAIASAINTMWAKIGGNEAVIKDASLAAATINSAEATRWNQVQSAVTDPATGKVYAASIVQDTKTFINLVQNKFQTLYGVKTQYDYKGKQVVGGFALSMIGNIDQGLEGVTIDFGVAADRFFITSTTSSGVGENTKGPEFPFIALTRPEVVNGVTYQPGVYIKKAVIGDASVDTLKIAGVSVTGITSAFGGGGVVSPGSSFAVLTASITMPDKSSGVLISGGVTLQGQSSGTSIIAYLINASRGTILRASDVSCVDGFFLTYSFTAFDSAPLVGSNTYQLHLGNPTGGPGSNKATNFKDPYIIVQGAKR